MIKIKQCHQSNDNDVIGLNSTGTGNREEIHGISVTTPSLVVANYLYWFRVLTETDENLYQTIVEDILPYGLPEAMYILYHPAFVIGYDGEKRIPRWVAHRIDSKTKRGKYCVW